MKGEGRQHGRSSICAGLIETAAVNMVSHAFSRACGPRGHSAVSVLNMLIQKSQGGGLHTLVGSPAHAASGACSSPAGPSTLILRLCAAQLSSTAHTSTKLLFAVLLHF